MVTADLNLAGGIAEAPRPVAGRQGLTVSVLTLRWVFLVVVTLIAFRRTIASVVDTTANGGLNGFVWLVPAAAVVAAIGVARRARTELPIHDRQTDVIVGILGLGLALMIQAVLLPRYSQYFHLLRLDLVAMWCFLVSSSIVLFGLRPVIRFGWVWLLLTLSFPLGYQLAVIFFGGNRASAGLASLLIAAAAAAVSVGRTVRRALVGALTTMLVGMVILVAMAALIPDAPVLAFQMVPSTLAMVLVGLGLFGYARRGLPKRWLDRSIEPLAARQVWAALPLVLIIGAAIALVGLPAPAMPAARVDGLQYGRPLAAPAGWNQTAQSDYPWVRRIFGRDADLIRQTFVADVGNPAWDKLARPRTVVVDSTSTQRPFSLEVYPTNVLYDASAVRVSDPLQIDLGHGVTGSLVTVVDDKRLLTFNLLTWSWRDRDRAQRVTVASVDNHEADAVFPEPNPGLAPTLQTMFSLFFRGNQAVWDSDPTFKDLGLLSAFGRGLVDSQLRQARK